VCPAQEQIRLLEIPNLASKNMQHSRRLSMKILVSILIAATTVLIPAALLPMFDSTPAQAQTKKSTSKEYQIGNLSFKAPSHWIDYSDGMSGITLLNQKMLARGGGSAPKNMIRLNAVILSQDLETSTAPHPRGMETTILKTENLTINGKKAVRQYTESDGAFPNAVVTYVELDTEHTIFVVVMYTRTNPYAEKFIEQINRSLTTK
jgi:hypothetical protein